MESWRIDNVKKFQILRSSFLALAIILVVLVLVKLQSQELYVQSWQMLFFTGLVMIFQFYVLPLEEIIIKYDKGEFFISKKNYVGSANIIKLHLTKGTLINFELRNSKSHFGAKLIVNYKDNSEEKKLEIALKHFDKSKKEELIQKTRKIDAL